MLISYNSIHGKTECIDSPRRSWIDTINVIMLFVSCNLPSEQLERAAVKFGVTREYNSSSPSVSSLFFPCTLHPIVQTRRLSSRLLAPAGKSVSTMEILLVPPLFQLGVWQGNCKVSDRVSVFPAALPVILCVPDISSSVQSWPLSIGCCSHKDILGWSVVLDQESYVISDGWIFSTHFTPKITMSSCWCGVEDNFRRWEQKPAFTYSIYGKGSSCFAYMTWTQH